jgi:hypothetical protein
VKDEEVVDGVLWENLPNDLLHPLIKAALRQANTPPVLDGQHLQMRVNHIQSVYTEEDWVLLAEEIGLSAPAPQAKKPARAPAKPLGELRWQDGGVVAQGRPPRTIPKNDVGAPMVPGQVSIDGLVDRTGDNRDEMGVGQA